MKKCALHNLGCKVNSYETQAMQQLMEDAGYEIIPFGELPADVFIINTCSVTNIADRKSRQMIHKARALNPDAVIAACGCYVESSGETRDRDIDIVIGNNEKSRLIEILDSYFAGNPSAEREDISKARGFDGMSIDKPSEHTRAYVKIQDGCNRFCSYCIIPYVRGRIRSRAKEDILAEVSRLAKSGCLEVVLTGIHLSSYGMDFESDKNVTLIDIIEETDRIEGIERIRLGSLEPLIVTEDFAKRLSGCRKVCPHFHLSLQSGCDSVLARMNRRYTTSEFTAGVEMLRKYFDRPAITTDVIVGFPGETAEEFETTAKYLRKTGFYELHVFKYSRRKGTVADRMEGQVPDRVKNERSEALLAIDCELSLDYRREYIGRRVSVLFEEKIIFEGRTYIVGFTDTYVRVAVDCDGGGVPAPNSIADVRVTGLLGKEMVIGVAEI